MNLISETGIWNAIDDETRAVLDEQVRLDLCRIGSHKSRRDFISELADELTNEIALCRDASIEEHIENGVVNIDETLPPDEWHELRAMMGNAVQGFYALRKLDIAAKQYIGARDAELAGKPFRRSWPYKMSWDSDECEPLST